jgi:mono/diheme cytochrome c family protein
MRADLANWKMLLRPVRAAGVGGAILFTRAIRWGAPYARFGIVTVALVLGTALDADAQGGGRSAKDVYDSACAACHGSDGTGTPAVMSRYPVVPPDFSDCSFASREPDADWLTIAHGGGPVRGFSRLMPAFGEALTDADLSQALAHVRTFCTDDAWPRGELNLPRPLVTEKAYPEDEAVLTIVASDGAVTNQFLYERRFGARNQIELVVPLELADRGNGDWTGGVGDVALAFKRAIAHGLNGGRIFSGAAELVLPTGSTERGLGGGTAIFEPFVAFGQILPADGFLQAQGGFEVPFDRDHSDELFWRAALGRSFTQGAYGRTWSPMIEVLGARELEAGARVLWDLVPQMQVTLNTRQHIMLNAGVRVPVNDRTDRSTQFMLYLLWDWYDGGLRDGW